jgi:DNA adenine methylase
LNRYCFNGVYRTNQQGHFNVPFGSKTGTIQNDREFVQYAAVLRAVAFRNMDFEECLADVGSGAFVYLDPPYALHGKSRAGEYGKNSFASDELPRLVDVCSALDRRGATFLLSYAANDRLLPLLPHKWYIEHVCVRRHIAGFARHRRMVSELLISNARLPTL